MKTRRDQFGRTLAPSRRNPRAEVVIATPAERLSEERMAVLGVDTSDEPAQAQSAQPAAPASQGPPEGSGAGDQGQDQDQGDQDQDQGDGDSDEGEEDGYPRHRGGPMWELSDGSTVRGSRDTAEDAERALHE